MDTLINLVGFSPYELEILTQVLADLGLQGRETGDEETPSPDFEGRPLALIALHRGTREMDLDRILYRYRAWYVGVLVEPEAPEILIRAASYWRVLTGLLPLKLEPLRQFVRTLVENRDREAAERRLGSGLISLEHMYQWKARELLISPAASQMTGQFRVTGFCSGVDEADLLQLAIEEALTNSLEHGCLELDSSIKDESPAGYLNYEELRNERLGDPVFAGRTIRVTLSVLAGEGILTIEDEGPGFDLALLDSYLACPGPDPETGALRGAGKGIYLISSIFDRILYTKGGRKIRLEKRKPKDRIEGKEAPF